MTDEEVDEAYLKAAVRAARPFLNEEIPYPLTSRTDGDSNADEVLWEHGFLDPTIPNALLSMGATTEQIERSLDRQRADMRRRDIVLPEDIVPLPAELLEQILDELEDSASEDDEDDLPDGVFVETNERLIKSIREYRVEMYSDEGPHAGRPHVAVYLPAGKVSISLDDPPVRLTPGPAMMLGERDAIRVIAKHRGSLLKKWHGSRPDDQKLKPKGGACPEPPRPPRPAPPAPRARSRRRSRSR